MRKQVPLVCQHVENISREAMAEFQDVIRRFVRRRQGIYALHRKGKLYYVGLASDLLTRLKAHLKDRHGSSWDRFSLYLTIGDSHLKELESLILRVTKPTGNKVKGTFAKSENLKRRLAADIKSVQREQYNGIIGKVTVKARQKSEEKGKGHKLNAYIRRPFKIRADYKGRIVRATVRKDGAIRFGGQIYNSPSLAAQAVVKHGCNGWYFWRYERAPGDWVFLNELRK